MKRARIGMAVALACCMALTGCGSQSSQSRRQNGSQGEVMRLSSGGTNGKEGTVSVQNMGDAESAYPAADCLDATLAETTNRFAYQFAQKLGGSGDDFVYG